MSKLEDLQEAVSDVATVMNHYQNIIGDLQAQIAKELKEKETETSWEWWLPSEGQRVWFNDFVGTATYAYYLEHGRTVKLRDNYGIFKTKEDAELFAPLNKWQRAVAWVLRELNDGWLPDWNNKEKDKIYFDYATDDNTVDISHAQIYQAHSDLLYGKSRRILEQCQEILGDEIIRKACGVY